MLARVVAVRKTVGGPFVTVPIRPHICKCVHDMVETEFQSCMETLIIWGMKNDTIQIFLTSADIFLGMVGPIPCDKRLGAATTWN